MLHSSGLVPDFVNVNVFLVVWVCWPGGGETTSCVVPASASRCFGCLQGLRVKPESHLDPSILILRPKPESPKPKPKKGLTAPKVFSGAPKALLLLCLRSDGDVGS